MPSLQSISNHFSFLQPKNSKDLNPPERCLVWEGHPAAGVEVMDEERGRGQRLLSYGGQLGAPHAVTSLVALGVARVKLLPQRGHA